MKRPAISATMKVDALLWHFDIKCEACGKYIFPKQEIQWDHIWALALGGPHNCTNLVPLHAACHREKTSGRKATTAGSDIGKISKERRIIRTQKMAVDKSAPSKPKEPPKPFSKAWYRQMRANPWPPGRKLKSRPFQKRAP